VKKNLFEDADGRIIVKWILEKCVVKAWFGFNRLRIGSNNWLFFITVMYLLFS
jgi:hypothetical protein